VLYVKFARFMLRPNQVLLFVFASFLALAGMSTVLKSVGSEKGVCVGSFCFKFFTITEMIGYEEFKLERARSIALEKENAETALFRTQLLESIHSLEDSIRVEEKLSEKDSTRFWLPPHQPNYFQKLFAEWDKLAQNKKLFRIVHYGDSQIEMDRITSVIRERLQQRFGGGGPGWLPPLQLVPSYTISQSSSGNWRRLVSYGASNDRASHNRYGVSGMLFPKDSAYASVAIQVRNKPAGQKLAQFEVAKVIVGNVQTPASITITYPKGSNTQRVRASSAEQMVRWNFDTSQSRLAFGFSGDTELEVLGIAIDAPWGIAMDNVAWRGSSGLTFTSISKASLQRTYRFLDVKMVIMQFGGNSVPYLKDKQAARNYAERFGKQIDYVRSIDSSLYILVIGPADMSINEKGQMTTHPQLEVLIEQMKEVANEKGAAFWSMYHAMGGYNSMARWVKNKPALGAPDYIHFSQKGAAEMSEILWQAMEREYALYAKKRRLEESKRE
jgi:lysophospholipase L1-like esterase